MHGDKSFLTVSQEICACPLRKKLMINMDTKSTNTSGLSEVALAIVVNAMELIIANKEIDLLYSSGIWDCCAWLAILPAEVLTIYIGD